MDYRTKIWNEILKCMVRYIAKHGYPPTAAEVGEELYMCTSYASKHMKLMVDAGMLETDHEGSGRAYRIPGYKLVKVKK